VSNVADTDEGPAELGTLSSWSQSEGRPRLVDDAVPARHRQHTRDPQPAERIAAEQPRDDDREDPDDGVLQRYERH
jgi:hypothetical protein